MGFFQDYLDWDHLRRRRLPFTDSPPVASVGVPYSFDLAIAGGVGPYTTAVVAGALPDGLSLTTNTVSGTPTGAEVQNPFIAITDANGRVEERQLEFVVH